MKNVFLIIAILLTGCSSSTLLDQLKLEDGETGSVCVRGNVDLNPFPLITSNATFVYKEHTDGVEAPDC